jgi:hypothetical protein
MASHLLRIDPMNANSQVVGTVANEAIPWRSITGLAYNSADGYLYGTDANEWNNMASHLLRIDPMNATSQFVGTLANPQSITGLAYNSADGYLYGTDANEWNNMASHLLRIDPMNATSQFVGTLANPQSITGLAYNSADGYLYGTDANEWNNMASHLLRIDPRNATSQVVGTVANEAIPWRSITGLAYVPQPKLCGLFLGSDHLPFIRGQADAQALEDKFKQFTAWEKSSVLQFDYTLRGDKSKSRAFAELQSYESLIKAGDTFIFFYSGHGGGGTGVDEWLAMNRDQPGPSDDKERKITDDDLASWFLGEELVGGRRRRDIWANVNKLFILDACHAGGFVGGSDDFVGEEDLMGLSHTAILAACDEDDDTYAGEDGRGILTVAVEEALILVNGYAQADSNRDGLTFDELAEYLKQYVYGVTYFDGRIKMDPAGDDLEPVRASLSLFSWKSDDFDGVIPEPATLSLLVLGGLALLGRSRAR